MFLAIHFCRALQNKSGGFSLSPTLRAGPRLSLPVAHTLCPHLQAHCSLTQFFSLLLSTSPQTSSARLRRVSVQKTASREGPSCLAPSPSALVFCAHGGLCRWYPLGARLLSHSVVSDSDCCPPGSSLHGILQARRVEWVAISSSRGSPWLRDGTCVSCFGRQILYHCATWHSLLPVLS